jgi:mannose-6-phosphate isomerase-like protein (cupin superfamily)
MPTTTGKHDKRAFAEADEVRTSDHGILEVVTIAGHRVGRATLQPGWRWSTDIKPLAQTELCEGEHLAPIVSGTLHVQMRDGTEIEYHAGDVMYVGPGHDAWVVGNEPCVTIDFLGFPDSATESK